LRIPRTRALASSDGIERAVAEIRHVTRVGALELALNVGEIVFHRIYGGDIELLRKNGPKHVSFGKLALHPELPMSKASLWRAVAIYELSLRVPQLKSGRHIGVSHVRTVLGLPSRDQERLLGRAERQRWRVAELQAHAASSRKGRGGRPPKLEILRVLDGLMRIAAMPVSAFSDRRAIEKLSAEDIECAVEMLSELDSRLKELEGLLSDISER
jgi:hypothetical protein